MITSGLNEAQLAHIVQLEMMEQYFTDPDSIVSPRVIAKALTCLAHDYVEIGLEECGHQLILKADNYFPGYHGIPLKEDMENDPEMKKVIVSLGHELILVALSTARDNK